MRLLICTQTVDRPDSSLGFFHRWVEELATYYEKVDVICLYKGAYTLPENVSVYSLGKEHGRVSRIRYAWRFFCILWRLRGTYDAVFVHMNQEYIVLGGVWWKLIGKKIYFWRNHYEGSLVTRLAGALCKRVFYTSTFSYTASFPNSMQMPVGVDIGSTHPEMSIERTPHSILFLARLDESKRPHMLLEALGVLKSQGVSFTATIAGGPSDSASTYPARLQMQVKELELEDSVTFLGAVPNTDTFRQYRSHEIFVNCSKSGMLDKTIFKALASGCLVVAASKDFGELVGHEFIFKENDVTDLAYKLHALLKLSLEEKRSIVERMHGVVEGHSLNALVARLSREMSL